MNKKELREEVLNKRDKIVASDREEKDDIIISSLMNNKDYKNSKKIFIYIGFGTEINTLKYIDGFIKDGKEIYVPKVYLKRREIEAIRLTSLDMLERSKYGILEPINDEIVDKEELDLIVVPGVAFDREGGRIGYGGGYYDKYFSRNNKTVTNIALAYDCQMVNKVPVEEHDVKVDCIITEKEVIYTK